MEFIIVIGATLILIAPIIWMWVNKIYSTGDDLFKLDEDDKTQIG